MKNKSLMAYLASLVLSISCLVNVANAGLIAFNDRISFENYLSGISVDNLTTMNSQGGVVSETFADFTVTGRMYECLNGSGCQATLPYNNMAGDYMWTYNTVNFGFTNAIVGFGIDFNSFTAINFGSSFIATLNGISSLSSKTGGFFGIASDNGTTFSNVSFAKNLSFGLFDNVTYASALAQPSSVPEPSTLAIFALGFIGLVSRRFKKQS